MFSKAYHSWNNTIYQIYAAYGTFHEDVGGLLHGSNVNRSCFYSNNSLGGSLSHLILSTIKALVGQGMRRTEREREGWTKVGQGQEQGTEGSTRDSKMEGVSLGRDERICERGRGHACFAVDIFWSCTLSSLHQWVPYKVCHV